MDGGGRGDSIPEIFIVDYDLLDTRVPSHEMLHQILWMIGKETKFMQHHKLFKKCKVL